MIETTFTPLTGMLGGIVGLAFFSKRSLTAVPTFMTTAIVTVYIKRHLLGG